MKLNFPAPSGPRLGASPLSSFVVFEADEGGGHAMFWEGPQKYNDSLRTFMRSY